MSHRDSGPDNKYGVSFETFTQEREMCTPLTSNVFSSVTGVSCPTSTRIRVLDLLRPL